MLGAGVTLAQASAAAVRVEHHVALIAGPATVRLMRSRRGYLQACMYIYIHSDFHDVSIFPVWVVRNL